MEFLLVFAITFIVLIGAALAFTLGRPPAYRPTRSQIMQLLVDVQEKKASVERWELFLSLPISHDPDLEKIRAMCVVVAFGDGADSAAQAGVNGALYDKEGMQRIRAIAVKLHKLIQAEPVSKWF